MIFIIKIFDISYFLFIKTKYVKGRHFVATNCCFVKPYEKRKQTNLLISTEVWTILDLLQKLNISS